MCFMCQCPQKSWKGLSAFLRPYLFYWSFFMWRHLPMNMWNMPADPMLIWLFPPSNKFCAMILYHREEKVGPGCWAFSTHSRSCGHMKKVGVWASMLTLPSSVSNKTGVVPSSSGFPEENELVRDDSITSLFDDAPTVLWMDFPFPLNPCTRRFC